MHMIGCPNAGLTVPFSPTCPDVNWLDVSFLVFFNFPQPSLWPSRPNVAHTKRFMLIVFLGRIQAERSTSCRKRFFEVFRKATNCSWVWVVDAASEMLSVAGWRVDMCNYCSMMIHNIDSLESWKWWSAPVFTAKNPQLIYLGTAYWFIGHEFSWLLEAS